MNDFNFKEANPRTLNQIDSYFQNSVFEREWDRKIQPIYDSSEHNGYGWNSIFEHDREIFMKAWYFALYFMSDCSVTEEQIVA